MENVGGGGSENSEALLRVLVADELGQIKVLESTSKRIAELKQIAKWGEPNRVNGIVSMAVEEESVSFAVGRLGGQCEVRDAATGLQLCSLDPSTSTKEAIEKQLVGLHFLTAISAGSDRNGALLTCTTGGHVHVYQRATTGTEDHQWEEVASWSVASGVLATAVDDAGEKLALACRGSQLSIWSIQDHKRVYQAKGPKPNRLGLVDKPWNTAVAFLPGSGGRRLVVGTNAHKLMVYDTANKRPCAVVEFREGKITALAPTADGGQCWAADSRGEVGCLELQTKSMQQVLKGVGGSVRSLALHPQLPYIASAGLDRYLRIHDLRTRKVAARVYLKQQLTGVVFCPGSARSGLGSSPGGGAQQEDAADITADQTDVQKLGKRRILQGGADEAPKQAEEGSSRPPEATLAKKRCKKRAKG